MITTLSELRRLEGEATPGIWWQVSYISEIPNTITAQDKGEVAQFHPHPSIDVETQRKNAQLIALMRNNIKALLDCVEALEICRINILHTSSCPSTHIGAIETTDKCTCGAIDLLAIADKALQALESGGG